MSVERIRQALLWSLLLVLAATGFWWLTRTPPVKVSVTPVERGGERTVANTRTGTVKACQRAKLSLSVGIPILIGLLAGVKPAVRAAALDPVVALRQGY